MNIEFSKLGIVLNFDMIGTLAIGLLSLYLGYYIKGKAKFLDKFGIPAAVIGGIVFALVHLVMRVGNIGAVEFNTTLLNPFMIVFFATIGLGSSVEGLKKGGKLLFFFWLLASFMTIMQTTIGVSIAKATGINPLFGVLAGSVSMTGGHGTAGAFGQTVEALGVSSGLSVALASATFGLVSGGLIGAPLGFRLIKKYGLKPEELINREEIAIEENSNKRISAESILKHVAVLGVIMTLGITLSTFVSKKYGIALPPYVGAMFVAIIYNNLNERLNVIKMDRNLIEIIGEVSLNVFLSMALISLKLWELASLAVPIFLILIGQVTFMWLYTRYIVFRVMGKNYDAAVMVSGMCGFGLGATTNAMINMGEVSNKYGYTANPYLIVPLTGAFLIDMVQIPVIVTAINLFS